MFFAIARRFIVTCFGLVVLSALASPASAVPLLWNKLGSTAEVLNSAYGPNLGFYNTTSFPDTIGNPEFAPGVFGNGIGIGPGSYGTYYREHTIVWSGVDQWLNPNRGTIEVWYKQNQDPVAFSHGVYRIFDGSYGLGSGIGLTSEIPVGPAPLLYFGLSFGGTYSGVSHNISSLNGTWMHLAGVWDRDGIASSADKIRLYLNGDLVASTTVAGWGNTVGQFADIAGGNDGDIAGKFAIDNLKVHDTAIADFSHRFNESAIPEPGLAVAAVLVLVPLRHPHRSASRAAR